MGKNNEERLFELRRNLETELPQVIIYTDIEGTYLHIIYNGESVCKTLLQKRDGYSIEFEREFVFDDHPSITWRSTSDGVVSCIRSRIRYYDEKKGQNTMVTLSDLRDYILQEIGDLVSAVYEVHTDGRHTDRIRIKYDDCWVCSIYEGKDKNSNVFDAIFYNPFTCRSAGYSPTVSYTVSDIPIAIKNRINICTNNNRIDINVNADDNTVAKAIYMMARGNGKTQYVSELLKNKTVVYNGNVHTNIENVIFNDPATIVFWTDGSKTVVKCQPGETFDPEKGLAMAISKKVLGNDYSYYETFAKYVGRYNKKRFNKALEEAKKVTPDEVVYNGKKYILADEYTAKSKEE